MRIAEDVPGKAGEDAGKKSQVLKMEDEDMGG